MRRVKNASYFSQESRSHKIARAINQVNNNSIRQHSTTHLIARAINQVNSNSIRQHSTTHLIARAINQVNSNSIRQHSNTHLIARAINQVNSNSIRQHSTTHLIPPGDVQMSKQVIYITKMAQRLLTTQRLFTSENRVTVAIKNILPKIILNLNQAESHNFFLICPNIKNCAQSMAVILPCSVQNF